MLVFIELTCLARVVSEFVFCDKASRIKVFKHNSMEKFIYCILHYGRPTLEVAAALFQAYPLGRIQNFTAFDVEIWGKEKYWFEKPGCNRTRMWRRIVRVIFVQNFHHWLRLYRKYAYSITPEGIVHWYKEVGNPMPCLARQVVVCSILVEDFDLAIILLQLFSIEVTDKSILRAVLVNGRKTCLDYFYPEGWCNIEGEIFLSRLDTSDGYPDRVEVGPILSHNSPLLSCEIQDVMHLWDYILKHELEKMAQIIFRLLDDVVKTKSKVGLQWLNEKFQLTFGEENYTGPLRQNLTAPLLVDGFELRVMKNGTPTAVQLFHRCRLLFCRE